MEKKNKTQVAAIMGLGYVGLPLALRAAEKEYCVYGFDLDKNKIEAIKKGKNPFEEKFIEKRLNMLSKINATSNPAVIKKADIVVVCVPTPVDEKFYPIFDPLISAIKIIIKNRKPGQLVIIESTINPGVCEEVLIPLFSEAKLTEGKDYFMAHCPERINPGKDALSKGYDVTNIARVVGAMSKKGLFLTQKFYESLIDAPIKPMGSIKEAEACKVVENSFRDINIAFVNELAKSFDKMKIDIKNVIEGAATKPFAFMPHWPSCGVGGHCIPVDPYYLIERAKEIGFDHKFLRIAREINNSMPQYSVELLRDSLNNIGLPMKGTNVGILGVSYKANVDDVRESPAIKIIELVKKYGSVVHIFDPHIPSRSTVKNITELLKKSQALILVTNHDEFVETAPAIFKKYGIKVIIDGKNCLDKLKIKKLGIIYKGIGR